MNDLMFKEQFELTFNNNVQDQDNKIDQVDYLNKLPEIFLYYSILKYRHEEKSEFGNFYILILTKMRKDKSNEHGTRIKNLKRDE